jgi:hypothetical protein
MASHHSSTALVKTMRSVPLAILLTPGVGVGCGGGQSACVPSQGKWHALLCLQAAHTRRCMPCHATPCHAVRCAVTKGGSPQLPLAPHLHRGSDAKLP